MVDYSHFISILKCIKLKEYRVLFFKLNYLGDIGEKIIYILHVQF